MDSPYTHDDKRQQAILPSTNYLIFPFCFFDVVLLRLLLLLLPLLILSFPGRFLPTLAAPLFPGTLSLVRPGLRPRCLFAPFSLFLLVLLITMATKSCWWLKMNYWPRRT